MRLRQRFRQIVIRLIFYMIWPNALNISVRGQNHIKNQPFCHGCMGGTWRKRSAAWREISPSSGVCAWHSRSQWASVALLDAGAQQGKVAVRVGGDGVHGAQNMLGQRQVFRWPDRRTPPLADDIDAVLIKLL